MAFNEKINAPPISERSAILDNYSVQLSKRDEALDRREHLLKRRERELEQQLERCKQQGRELEVMRSTMYQEKTAFQLTADKRKEEFEQAEASHRAVAENLTGRMAIVNELLETSKKTAAELREKREELKQVTENLAQMHSALRTAKKTVGELRTKSEQALVRERKCAEIVVSLDERKTELDSLESKLSALETELTQRERSMADRLSDAEVVLPLKRVLPDLRKVVNDYSDFRQSLMGEGGTDSNPTPSDDPQTLEDEVRVLQKCFRDLRTHARAVAVRENSCAKKEDSLAERERSLATVESSISAREQTLRDAERNLSVRSKEVELQMKEAKAVLQRSEDNTRRVMQQEERLSNRESAVQEREALLKEKESHLTRQRKVSVAQEKSLERAGEAVKSHEAEVANDARKVQEMRLRLESLEGDISSREALLKTKEVELVVREAAVDVSNRRARHEITRNATRVTVRSADPEAAVEEAASQLAGRGSVPSLNMSEIIEDRPASEASDQHDKSSVAASEHNDVSGNQPANAVVDTQNPDSALLPSTVRKQLTFGFTPNNLEQDVPPNQAGLSNLENGSDHSEGSEAESERAAQQLHDELKAARGLWIEKVNRLDNVVASMSVDLMTTGTQLLPVIRNVREELQRIRAEAQEEPKDNQSPASAAFAVEQERHREWALSMTAQLNTIKEVQEGLLHAFNRVLPSNMAGRDRDPFFTRRPERNEYPQIEHLQTVRMEDSEGGNPNSKSRTHSTEENSTDELLRKLAPAKPRRKHRKGSRRRRLEATETSITDNSNEQKQFSVAVPGWHNLQRPLARLPLTPLGTSHELDELRKEFGLDPVSR